MLPLKIYQLVNVFPVAMSQNDFINAFNDTQREINNKYGDKYTTIQGMRIYDIESINGGTNLRDEYTDAVVERIKFAATEEDKYLSRYEYKRETAFLKVWCELSKNKFVQPRCWR